MTGEELEAYLARLESDLADLNLALQSVREELADAVAGDSVQAPVPSLDEVEEWRPTSWRTCTRGTSARPGGGARSGPTTRRRCYA